jgi:hypothetical protein
MIEDRSVLDKALHLQSEARRLDSGREGERQVQRIRERAHMVRAALGDLRNQAHLARILEQRTGISVDLSGLEAGRKELARKAGSGLPGDPAFNAASRRIKETIESLSKAILDKWRNWADGQLALLPVSRISMLGQARQVEARSTLKSLKNYAASPRLAAADINLFAMQCEGLKDELGQAPDAPEPLLVMLGRLGTGTLTLRDVTDEEIALLRQYSMDQEIEVRRKSS